VDRESHGPARVREPALDRLTDPQRPVGRELEALSPVELLDRPDQAEHALLDEVGQWQAEALVLARHGDHEPQVRVDHPILGHQVTALDALRELHLFGGRQKRMASRVCEEELERVGDAVRGWADGRDRFGAGRLRLVLLSVPPSEGRVPSS
jgi:hypothetical protein